MLNSLRFLIILGGIALTALIVWAFRVGDFGAEGAWLTSHPWGIVSLVDLYLGFVMMAFVIALVERGVLARLFWIAPIFVLGNVWPVLWLILRGFPRLIAALTPPAPE